MIWLNIKELEQQLMNGSLPDKVAFEYLLTHLILLTITNFITDDDPGWAIAIYLIASLIAVIWGVKNTFEINRQGDNRDYFRRFISISLVVSIRLLVFIFAIAFIIVITTTIGELAGSPIRLSSLQQDILDLVGSLLIMCLYFYMLINSFKRVSAGDETRQNIDREVT